MEAAQTGRCAECGGTFALENMIRYGTQYVCAACKPVFMQKLQEGVKSGLNAALNYAGFWIRVGASLIDGLIVGVVVVVLVVALVFGVIGVEGLNDGTPNPALALGQVLVTLGVIAYEVIFTAKYGGTLGKLACGLKVVTADGQNVSYLRALGRFFAHRLSGLICFIGYIMVAFDEECRGLHDRICDTRVVFK